MPSGELAESSAEDVIFLVQPEQVKECLINKLVFVVLIFNEDTVFRHSGNRPQ